MIIAFLEILSAFAASSIIDVNKQSIPIYSGMNELVLVTCYPFDAIQAGGSKRYIAKFSYIYKKDDLS